MSVQEFERVFRDAEYLANKYLTPEAAGEYLALVKSRMLELHSDWIPTTVDQMLTQRISIGMTCEQVRVTLGAPNDIHRTVTAYGTSQQWVYTGYGAYIYFENDVVTAIQK